MKHVSVSISGGGAIPVSVRLRPPASIPFSGNTIAVDTVVNAYIEGLEVANRDACSVSSSVEHDRYFVALLVEKHLLGKTADDRESTSANYTAVDFFYSLFHCRLTAIQVYPGPGIFHLQLETILSKSRHPIFDLLGSVILIAVDHGVFQQLPGNEQYVGWINHFQMLQHVTDNLHGNLNEGDIGMEFQQKIAGING
jgi:hypothetical protein